MNSEHNQMALDAGKVVTVWAAVGITTWADAASAAAFLYTLILLFDWCWKKFIRGWVVAIGWLKDAGE